MPNVDISASLGDVAKVWQTVDHSQSTQDALTKDIAAAAGGAAAGVSVAAATAAATAAISSITYSLSTGVGIVAATDTAISAGSAAAAEVAAATGFGAELGPLGAAIGAIIGVMVAAGGPAAVAHPFMPNSPIEIYKDLIGGGNLLFREALEDVDTAIALTSWSATGSDQLFKVWLNDFLNDRGNAARLRIYHLLHQVPSLASNAELPIITDNQVQQFAATIARLSYAMRNPPKGQGWYGDFENTLFMTDADWGGKQLLGYGGHTSDPMLDVHYYQLILSTIINDLSSKDALTMSSHSPIDDVIAQMQQMADESAHAAAIQDPSHARPYIPRTYNANEPVYTHLGNGVLLDPVSGHIATIQVPQLTWFERLLQWFEHLLHIQPGPMAGVHGVFGNDYAEHRLPQAQDDYAHKLNQWMSDPVRSTIAIDVDGMHADEGDISSAIESGSGPLAEAISRIEGGQINNQDEQVASIGIRLVRMKRAVETIVARAYAGDKDCKYALDEMYGSPDILGLMARDYVKLADVEPLQAAAMTRPVSYDQNKYPLA